MFFLEILLKKQQKHKNRMYRLVPSYDESPPSVRHGLGVVDLLFLSVLGRYCLLHHENDAGPLQINTTNVTFHRFLTSVCYLNQGRIQDCRRELEFR